ncbi:MAG: hypothetical protein GYA33_12545 [Thermogutta sp.]|nr:hypothetical protein [Thermogutta sp.]
MLTVHVFRHAWAEEADAKRWPDDGLRPLTSEGQARFRKFAEKLAARSIRCQSIATSPLVRCVQTAEILCEVCESEKRLEILKALRPDSDFEAVLAWIRDWNGRLEEVALVGHAPDVAQLAAWFIGGGNLDCPKGGVTSVMFEKSVEPGRGILIRLVKPSLLKC